MKQFSFILIGAGGRGMAYSREMMKLPEKYKMVAMADPVALKRENCIREFGLTESDCYEDWRDILARPKMADIAIIATMDDMHYEPAMKAIELGYDLLLEKPAANTERECVEIANAAKKAGVRVLVCHVLRYTPFYKKVKQIIESGMIGDVVSVDQTEGIGNIHFSHSYVRGNWHSLKTAAPMLLAKSCHDIDMIQWLVDKPCKKVSSFGELTYFTEQNAPEGSPVRCAGGNCPHKDECPYECEKIYVHPEGLNSPIWRSIFTSIVATHNDFSDDDIRKALSETDFGLCVFHANNDVLDHQVMNMEFEGGATATLNVNAFNGGGRHTRVYGTKGELYAFMSDDEIFVRTFVDKERHYIPVKETEESIGGGHGGGDSGIVADLYDYLCGTYTGSSIADIGISVYNHMLGFAAEKARKTETVVSVKDFCEEFSFQR